MSAANEAGAATLSPMSLSNPTSTAAPGRPTAPAPPPAPLTALAPMQAVTDAAFMGLVAGYGAPDLFVTEYVRVHEGVPLDPDVVRAVEAHGPRHAVYAQLIGEHVPSMVRAARALQAYQVAGIDLNLGCPAPKLYKKNVGGGLLRDPAHVDRLLGALRDAVSGRFTVKMRLGFDSPAPFETILDLVDQHAVDLLTVHGRTVADMYRPGVRYDLIAQAVGRVRCPVLANGDVTSPAKAAAVLAATGAAGVMVGRHAIRNPWIFAQIRDQLAGRPVVPASRGALRDYVDRLYAATAAAHLTTELHVARTKKHLSFVGLGVDPDGAFLYAMRRARSEAELFAVCDAFLLDDPSAPLPLEPYPGLHARPNTEADRARGGVEAGRRVPA